MPRTLAGVFLVLALRVVQAHAESAGEPTEASIRAFVEAYDRAFVAKVLSRLAAFYHPDVTIFEGGHVNNGWVDYRDNHLGPEGKEMEELRFSHAEVVPHVLADGSAYVTGEYSLATKIEGRAIESEGARNARPREGVRRRLEDSAFAHLRAPPAACRQAMSWRPAGRRAPDEPGGRGSGSPQPSRRRSSLETHWPRDHPADASSQRRA